MRYVNEALLTNGDATQATVTSPYFDASYCVAVSVQAVAAGGTITGTLQLQASNDNPATTPIPVNWTNVTGATVSIAAAGPYMIPKLDVSYQWLRVVYTKTTSAAGALISANAKTVGF